MAIPLFSTAASRCVYWDVPVSGRGREGVSRTRSFEHAIITSNLIGGTKHPASS